MRDFDELARVGQARRIRPQLPDIARLHFSLDVSKVIHASVTSFNTVFHLEAEGGRRYGMRVGGRHRIHPPGTEEIEASWLLRLTAETDVIAPRPVSSKRDRHREDVEFAGVPFPCPTSMFTWVDGEPARKHLGPETMRMLGATSARLHEHAAQLGRTIAVPNELQATPAVYFGDNRLDTHPITATAVVREAVERTQAAIDELWRSPPHAPHLIHGDLSSNNAVIRRGRLAVIDFQDLRLGFDIQDLAITLADLERSHPDLAEPFRQGYSSFRPWPEWSRSLHATLAAARRLNIMNLGVILRRAGLEQFLESHVAAITQWMHDGK